MKKIFLILMLIAFGAWAGSDYRWKSASSTDMNAYANYAVAGSEASGAFGATDTLTFFDTVGITEVNATATANVSCAHVRVISGYGGNWSMATFVLTVTQGYAFDDNGTIGGGLGQIASGGTLHIGSGTGTGAFTGCTLSTSGTVVIDADKSTNTAWAALRPGNSATVTTTGAQITRFLITGSTVPAFAAGNDVTLTVNSPLRFDMDRGVGISYGTNFTWNGSGSNRLYYAPSAANLKLSLPKIVYSGTGGIQIAFVTNNDGDTIVTDTINTGSAPCSLYTGSSSTGTGWRLFVNQPITCDGFVLGTTKIEQTMITTFANKSYDYSSFKQASTGADTVNFAGTHYCAGNWAYATPGAGDLINPGTFVVVFDSSLKTTISTGNHTAGFYDCYSRKSGVEPCSLADSITLHTWTGDSGSLKTGAKNMRIGGDWVLRGRPQDTAFSTMGANQATFTNSATFQLVTQYTKLDSMTFNPLANLYFDIDKGVKVRRVTPADGKKITVKAGQVLTLAKNVVRDFTGTNAASCSLVSSSAGNRAYIVSTVQPEDTALFVRDMGSRGFIWYDTIGTGHNGMNDSNFMFRDTLDQLYLTPAPVASLALTDDSLTTAGGADTCTGTGFYGDLGDSLILDGTAITGYKIIDSTKIAFTAPAKSAGQYNLVVRNADGQKDTTVLIYYAASGGGTRQKGGFFFGRFRWGF